MSGGRRELPFVSPTQWRFYCFFGFRSPLRPAILNLVSGEVSEISRRRAIRHTYFRLNKKRNYSHKYVQINISRHGTLWELEGFCARKLKCCYRYVCQILLHKNFSCPFFKSILFRPFI